MFGAFSLKYPQTFVMCGSFPGVIGRLRGGGSGVGVRGGWSFGRETGRAKGGGAIFPQPTGNYPRAIGRFSSVVV